MHHKKHEQRRRLRRKVTPRRLSDLFRRRYADSARSPLGRWDWIRIDAEAQRAYRETWESQDWAKLATIYRLRTSCPASR